jgi:NADPH:quinone reductase-like Zn-dependent oxidoreductase
MSRHNHELVSTLGATPIDYRVEDWVERVRALTGGVDAVFDPIGARQLWRSYRTLPKAGAWCGSAWPRRRVMGCGSFRSDYRITKPARAFYESW